MTEEKDDDFSWDMEDEDDDETPAPAAATAAAEPASLTIPSSTSTTEPTTAPDTPRQTTVSSASSDAGDWGLSPALGPSSPVQESSPIVPTSSAEVAATSPRTSSDGTAASYDLVGERSGAPSSIGDESWTSRRGSKEGSSEEAPVVAGTGASVMQEKKEDSDEDSDWE